MKTTQPWIDDCRYRITDGEGGFAFFRTYDDAEWTRKIRGWPTIEVRQHWRWVPVDYGAAMAGEKEKI